MIIRLSKYLSDAGVCARRKAEEAILRGQVKVNGQVVAVLGTKVDTEKDHVFFDGKRVAYQQKYLYLLLHKPEGYVTTANDERGRPTVLELLKDVKARVFPVGRLDYNTSGLLLLTNDGDLAYRLTHPKHTVRKTYRARVKGVPSESALNSLRQGIQVEDYITAPAKVTVKKKDVDATVLEIVIHEGRNRQVRKMCTAIGHEVMSLKRVATGKLELLDLPKGKYRHLTPAEVAYLKGL